MSNTNYKLPATRAKQQNNFFELKIKQMQQNRFKRTVTPFRYNTINPSVYVNFASFDSLNLKA